MATIEKPPATSPSDPPALQFGLRTLLIAMAGVCALLALGARFGGYAALTLLLFIALAIAHVVGNAFGTSLRERAGRATDPEKPTPPPPPPALLRPPGTTLRTDLPLTRRSMVGTILGGLAGATLVVVGTSTSWAVLGIVGVLIVAMSGSVIGSIAGFMASRFTSAFGRAMWQSLERGKPHEPDESV